MPGNGDDVLYDERDGRELDERAWSFARSCIRALKETGYYDKIKGKSVLDVGCGIGCLLSLLPTCARYGVDPQPGARAHAVEGIDVLSAYFGPLVDCVMSWHVLEHVDDPFAFINGMVSHCKSGGHIMIATPNASSPFARSDSWRCREPYHHYLIDKPTLIEMVSDAGIDIEHWISWGGFPSPRSWWQDIGNWVAKRLGLGDVQLIIGRKR